MSYILKAKASGRYVTAFGSLSDFQKNRTLFDTWDDADKERKRLLESPVYANTKLRIVPYRSAAELREERLRLRAALVKARPYVFNDSCVWDRNQTLTEIDAALARRKP